MQMDLTLLKYFYTVTREGSFMAAAEKLDYAQSNLSMRIKQLEEAVGSELLIRGRNGVTLTEKGRILYSYADKLLYLSEEAECAVKGDGYSTGSLTIATMESVAVTFLPGVLAKFHNAYPETSVKVTVGTSDAGVRAVLANDADSAIAVGENTHEELSSIPLRKERLVLVTNRSESENDLKELLRKPLLVFPSGCAYRRVMERMLADYGLAPARMMEFSSLGSILASISAGFGVSVFPVSAITAFSAGDSLRMIPLPDEYETADIYLITRRQSAGNRTLCDFITTITTEEK
jgi:DNA-binding transcriptional LysR family regulator